MTRDQALNALVQQVNHHTFYHLFRNRRTGHHSAGWSGGLSMYSTNNENSPNPVGHFHWLSVIIQQVNAAVADDDKIAIANNVLQWGGMALQVQEHNLNLLNNVITKAHDWNNPITPPMNSSWTKLASIFAYHNGNTIWDSRVSTAVCFRLSCIFKSAGDDSAHVRSMFPDLGFIPGMSRRVKRRMPLIQEFWPNVYSRWSGHIAGAQLMQEIANKLNLSGIDCPPFIQNGQNNLGGGVWNAWKVNMVFFADDLTYCPRTAISAEENNKLKKICDMDCDDLCDHRIINNNHGIHFEPCIISGKLNDASSEGINLPDGAHGLGSYRILMEFFRMENGNCKISARMRLKDPCFEKVWEASQDAGCPPKRGGIDPADETCSVFVYSLGCIPEGREIDAIRNFVCDPKSSYLEFLHLLPNALTID